MGGGDPRIVSTRGASVRSYLRMFGKDDRGLTMVEYAVAGALVSVAAATLFTDLGTAIVNKIASITATLGG